MVISQKIAVAEETARESQKVLLDRGMQAVENTMHKVTASDVEVLHDASHHILSAGGKRVRPRLLLLSYLANGGSDVAYAAIPAAAVELMHTASVVHDDINDHGIVRRGQVSVNARWGRTFALLTGDFLFTAVYQLMSPYKDMNIVLADAATALVEGETLQAWAVKNKVFTSEMYTRIIGLKTAALFESATEMGATLAGASDDVIEAFKRAGYNIGLAFQIVDDILDIVGDEGKLGKTAGIDIHQGRGIASVGNRPENPEDPMEGIKRKFMEGDRLEKARSQAQMLVDMAIADLNIVPDSYARGELIALAELVINRDH